MIYASVDLVGQLIGGSVDWWIDELLIRRLRRPNEWSMGWSIDRLIGP